MSLQAVVRIPASRFAEISAERVVIEDAVAYRFDGEQCSVYLEPRPAYCDRGTYKAILVPQPGSELERDLDAADGWPRYYLRLSNAIDEITLWINRREGVS